MAAITSSSLIPLTLPFVVSSSTIIPTVRPPKAPAEPPSLEKFPVDKVWQAMMDSEKNWVKTPKEPVTKEQIMKMVELSLKLGSSMESFYNIRKAEAPGLPKMHLFRSSDKSTLSLYFKLHSKTPEEPTSKTGGSKDVKRTYRIVIATNNLQDSFAQPATRLKARPTLSKDRFELLLKESPRWLELSTIEGVCKLYDYATYTGKHDKLKHIMYADHFHSDCWSRHFSGIVRHKICLRLIRAVAAMHARGIFHGDIAATNILVKFKRSATGNAFEVEDIVFTDFGSSFIVGMNTRIYLAPEGYNFDFTSNGHLFLDGFRLDRWSLGCVFFAFKVGFTPVWSSISHTLYELETLEKKLKNSTSTEESKTAISATDISSDLLKVEESIQAIPNIEQIMKENPEWRAEMKKISNAIAVIRERSSCIIANKDSLESMHRSQEKLFDLLFKAFKKLYKCQADDPENKMILGLLHPDPNQRMSLTEAERILQNLIIVKSRAMPVAS